MDFDRLIDRPSAATLGQVINGRRLDLIAPFARRGPLERIVPASHDRVRLIVRLPRPTDLIPKRLDNDPRDFVRLLDRMAHRAHVYALPRVHTKLYLNGTSAYFGSANFTSSGFGRNPEALLVATEPSVYEELRGTFDKYLHQSTRLPLSFLRRLSLVVEQGDAEVVAAPEQPVLLVRDRNADDIGNFRNWLNSKATPDALYAEARFDPGSGYNMTGHAYSAFYGIRAFLGENLDLIPELAGTVYVPNGTFWSGWPEMQGRFAGFVRAKGHLYPGQGGGPWRNKLPPSLGGHGPGGGGMGSGLVARMLILLSRYAIERGF
ncbi:MAG: PLD-like domain [Alphaproteobacteria bacterium]|jgi:hypothetical protein|nr:PLD-like domain [Alphaproteobacteria bacterium]